jgi:S1/P1 Nuclease
MGTIRFGCLLLFAMLGSVPTARGWGCKGHQIVALIAEKYLTPQTRSTVAEILDAGPISPDLRRYCHEGSLDAFADSSTWADDQRNLRPETAGWHFLDIPRGAAKRSVSEYCPPSTGCVTSAISLQVAILRDHSSSAQARADALRFVIHFVGDLHQPLHATTNDDRGGNCLPVAFFGHEPEEINREKEDYRPNLHGVWDTDILEKLSHGETPQEFANELEARFQKQIATWQSEPIDIPAWAWESHQLAEETTYGRLPKRVAIERPREVNSCADDDHISTRMLTLHEELGDEYVEAARQVVAQQLMKAAIRLAKLLNAPGGVTSVGLEAPLPRRHDPSTQAKMRGATIVASDSMTNLGVSTPSFPHVIFSFGTAPE